MTLSMLLLTVVAVLIYFGVMERVLDRMRLSDRAALTLIALMFIGTLIPNVIMGKVSVNVGGAVIPLGVCLYMLIKARSTKVVLRSVIGSIMTGALIWGAGRLLPDEPEAMWIEPNLLYGLAGGVIAYALGRSRRGAFICGVAGVILADIVTAVINWQQGIDQQLILGGAGIADTAVISGVVAVLLAELVGEVRERIARGKVGHA